MNIQRVLQGESLCGPTTLQMLLSVYDIQLDQLDIAKAGKSEQQWLAEGFTMTEMSHILHELLPGYHLLFKCNSSADDICDVIERFAIPVGVEWQGKFQPGCEGDETGHYSVITSLDDNYLLIVDPDEYCNLENNRIARNEFNELWWAVNDSIKSQRCIFVVVPTALRAGIIRHGFSEPS